MSYLTPGLFLFTLSYKRVSSSILKSASRAMMVNEGLVKSH